MNQWNVPNLSFHLTLFKSSVLFSFSLSKFLMYRGDIYIKYYKLESDVHPIVLLLILLKKAFHIIFSILSGKSQITYWKIQKNNL